MLVGIHARLSQRAPIPMLSLIKACSHIRFTLSSATEYFELSKIDEPTQALQAQSANTKQHVHCSLFLPRREEF